MTDIVPILTVLFLCLVATSHAWLFFRRYPSARSNRKIVSEECAEKAQVGSCDFYACFEDRLSCGKHWYNVKYGQPYCKDFRAFASKFSEEGQKFINATEICMGRNCCLGTVGTKSTVTTTPTTPSRPCPGVISNTIFVRSSRLMPSILSRYIDHSIYFSRGAMKIWKEIIRIAYHCEPKVVKDLVINFYESMTE